MHVKAGLFVESTEEMIDSVMWGSSPSAWVESSLVPCIHKRLQESGDERKKKTDGC
jgi:hypothetical protein